MTGVDGTTVRLIGAKYDRHITRKIADLHIRNESPGGYSSVTLSLNEPLTAAEINHFDTILVYDAQTAEVVGAGRLEDPGKSVDSDGQVWEITAIGIGPAHTEDVEQGYVCIETHLDGFRRRFRNNGPGATAEVGSDTGGGADDEALFFQFPGGMDLVDGTAAAMVYDTLDQTGQNLGAWAANWDGGNTLANTDIQIGTETTPNISTASLTTTGGSFLRVVNGSGSFTAGDKQVRVRMRHNTTTLTVANDLHWASVTSLRIHAQLHTKDGTALVSGAGVYNDNWVTADEVVEDILGGGRLPLFDGANATVAAGTHQINQFAYPDAVKVRNILDDLMGLESAFTWHVWGPSAFNPDLWEFEWVAKPTTVRYEASVVDGFTRPSTSSEVYDKVAVRWTDERGRIRQTTRTAAQAGVTVPLLTDAGISRTASLDLADEVGSLENAQRAGDRFLIDHVQPPNQGTLTIARPIRDLITGRLVHPRRIRAGNLIRVRGIDSSPDSLNASSNDGVTVFHIISAEYTESESAAVCELDTYTPTDARELAGLARHRNRKR